MGVKMGNEDVVAVQEPDKALVQIHESICKALPGHTVMLMVFGPHGTPEPHKFTILLNDDEMQEMLLRMFIMHHERSSGTSGNDPRH